MVLRGELEAWRFYTKPRGQRPSPHKFKYILIAYRKGSVGYGFLVNSNISPETVMDERLLICQALLPVSSQNFLRHDSFLDCIQLRRFTRSNVLRLQDRVTRANLARIVHAVEECPRRSPGQRAIIRASADEYLSAFSDENEMGMLS